MMTTKLKQLFIVTSLTSGLIGCGGSGDSSVDNTSVENNPPIISAFSSENTDESNGEINFNWTVTDANSDKLSCILTLGDDSEPITIDDCITTNTTNYTYASIGNFTASIAVSDSSNASTSSTADVSVANIILPDPVITAADNELVVFYNREDGNYDGWILHLWNNDSCDAYADFPSGGGTDWNVGQTHTAVDPNYGAYYVIPLKADHSDCANFIVHNGGDKDIGGLDHQADLSAERMIWTLSGFSDLFTTNVAFPTGVQLVDTAAHWINQNTVFWNASENATKVRIYSATTNDIGFSNISGIAGDNYLEYLVDSSTDLATSLGMSRYSGLSAFTNNDDSGEKAKTMLTGKLVALAYDDNDNIIAATHVQSPRIIDALYTSTDNDANEASLGVIYNNDRIQANVWAPTATNVNLNIFNADKELQSSNAMVIDTNTGIWSFAAENTVDRQFYQYELNVYHPLNQQFETVTTTDPYSVSLSTNGSYSQFVNLTDADLKPANWDEHTIPEVIDPEDAVIYEGHIRDFSIRDESTSAANRGNYLAFTEETSAPVMHLKSLVDAGLTHFQTLPANDIATIEEDSTVAMNLSNTVSDVCAVNSSSPVCGVEDGNATLESVLASYDPTTTDAQALVQSIRGLDSFNWGYDPKHFNAPEGSYASNADGVARILEMREMNKALHDMGLRVILDVVYNHTSSSGLYDNSVLDKVVPGYYHRRDLVSGIVEQATCCQDTAPEHAMMQKLMEDSLVIWSEAYKFDGFRFDIMSNNSKDSILTARDIVQAIDEDSYFYGEGWTRADRGYEQAQQNNMAGTQVATFNDRPRDRIRSAALFSETGSLEDQDTIRLGLAGTLANYQMEDQYDEMRVGSTYSQSSYALDPADIINYVSKHDNETLWDQLQYGIDSSVVVADRVRMQNIAGTIPFISQGIPFFQLGGDLIRSKSMDRNTYDAGDWFNLVDFTKTTNNWNVGLPLAQDNEGKWTTMSDLINNSETAVSAADIEFSSAIFKEFLAIRASSKLFRLTTEQDVIDRVGFHNTGSAQIQGLIVMSIDDGTGLTDLDAANDAIVIIVNGTSSEQAHSILTASGFSLHSVQQNSADSLVQTASFIATSDEGTFTVPALTTAVFVKTQGASQGQGLAADATVSIPDPTPLARDLYVRGDMNNWGNDGLTASDLFSYEGNDLYLLDVELSAGTYQFKLASSDWADVNFGFNELSISDNSITINNNGGNLEITIAVTGNYSLSLDVSGDIPLFNVIGKTTSTDCTALVDSTDDNPFNVTGNGNLYVRGDHSGWNPESEFLLHYKGNNQYQAVADFDGAMQFKLASNDGSWTTQLWVQRSTSDTISGATLELGVPYPIAYGDAGNDNNRANLEAGSYSFLLTLNEANPAQGFNIGNLVIQQCE